ncbi:sulfite exporter TauE/SafE family protein [Candidatus Nomurabacteria bacterium]|nr:sulfite exporter TauE/SafE family protein [Candidatus Nomurabacteria bacterium]
MEFPFLIAAFISGVFTFFAPCTFPLLPAYMSFITGASVEDLKGNAFSKRRILENALAYVFGFSLVFVLMGSIFGFFGQALAMHREILTRLAGLVVIFFGLYLMHAFDALGLTVLTKKRSFLFFERLKPGKPYSSFLFGLSFAFGWTPCIGPVLGSILTIAATKGQLFSGAGLLGIFSLGLAVPFLLSAALIVRTLQFMTAFQRFLNVVSILGGILLVVLGVFMVFDAFVLWIEFFYSLFGFINYEAILDYL